MFPKWQRDDIVYRSSWGEMMRAVVVIAGVLLVGAAQAEPRVFYTAHFPDRTSIEMSVIGDGVSDHGGYDFDVSIGLAKINATGKVIFFDGSSHHAQIRCAEPAYVGFGNHRFSVHATSSLDWKQDLWKAYCDAPVS